MQAAVSRPAEMRCTTDDIGCFSTGFPSDCNGCQPIPNLCIHGMGHLLQHVAVSQKHEGRPSFHAERASQWPSFSILDLDVPNTRMLTSIGRPKIALELAACGPGWLFESVRGCHNDPNPLALGGGTLVASNASIVMPERVGRPCSITLRREDIAMSRPAWKGFLRLSLVSVPVRAYTTMVTGQGEIHLNQLHAECHSRIRYKKVCPVHGEVSKDEIVMGYEYSKGNYVEISEDERNKARTKSDKSIDIEKFVPVEKVDPMYFEGLNYYLLPEGASGQKPYALFYQAMEDEQRCAVAHVAMSGRDRVVIVTPKDRLLVMHMLNYESQMKSLDEFQDEIPDARPKAEELKLAKMLIESTFEDELDLSQYHDTYTEKLKEVIEAKVAGQEILNPPADEPPQVVNLMEALRKSVSQAKGKKPMQKMVESHRELTKPKRRRKSS